MNFALKPIARSRLKKTNAPYQALTIEGHGAHISVVSDARAPIEGTLGGKSFSWKREDGEVFQVGYTESSGRLVQTFSAEDGSRENSYSWDEKGRLLLTVTVRSPKLSAPLVYRLVYNKA